MNATKVTAYFFVAMLLLAAFAAAISESPAPPGTTGGVTAPEPALSVDAFAPAVVSGPTNLAAAEELMITASLPKLIMSLTSR